MGVMDTNQSKSKGPAVTTSGMVVGIVIGVILSVVLDSWAWMGVGVAIGLLMFGTPLFGRRANAGTPTPEDT